MPNTGQNEWHFFLHDVAPRELLWVLIVVLLIFLLGFTGCRDSKSAIKAEVENGLLKDSLKNLKTEADARKSAADECDAKLRKETAEKNELSVQAKSYADKFSTFEKSLNEYRTVCQEMKKELQAKEGSLAELRKELLAKDVEIKKLKEGK